MLRFFLADERGSTALEYALIASLIAVAIVAAVSLTGQNTATKYDDLANSMP